MKEAKSSVVDMRWYHWIFLWVFKTQEAYWLFPTKKKFYYKELFGIAYKFKEIDVL